MQLPGFLLSIRNYIANVMRNFRKNITDEEDSADFHHDNNTSQERFRKSNKGLFIFFKCFGLYLHKFDKSKHRYVLCNGQYVIWYLVWYLWPLVGLGIAFAGVIGFGLDDGISEVDDGVEASLYILGFAVVPAFQTYVIKLIGENIPTLLFEMQNLKPFHGLKVDDKVHLLMWKKISPFKNFKHNFFRQTVKDNILQIMPQITFLISIIAFMISFLIGCYNVVYWIYVKAEWPLFVIQFFFMSFPAVSTWFCVAFLSWHCQNYKAIQKFVKKEEVAIFKQLEQKNRQRPVSRGTIRQIMESEKNHINDLGDYVDGLQHIFSVLANRIIKYTFGVNFLVFVTSSLFCTYKIISSMHHIFYTFPIMISLFHIFISCERGNLLMYQYEKTVEEVDKILTKLRRKMQSNENPELQRKQSVASITSNMTDVSLNVEDTDVKEKQKDHLQDSYNKVQRLLENLRLSKPQVMCFNSLKVNYNTFAAVIGFIVSYAALVIDVTGVVCDCASSENTTSTESYTYNPRFTTTPTSDNLSYTD